MSNKLENYFQVLFNNRVVNTNRVEESLEICKKFSVSFNVFCRENYSTRERWENEPLPDNIWRCYKTDEEFTTEELYTKFLKIYGTEI